MKITEQQLGSVAALQEALARPDRPLVRDVRRPMAFLASTEMIRGALREATAMTTQCCDTA